MKSSLRFKPEKDETDMEHALNWAIEQNPRIIRIFGATGGRIDHMFANLQLLINPLYNKENVTIEMIDQKNIIYLKTAGNYSIEKLESKKYISFIPMSNDVKGMTLKGFKYPLTIIIFSLDRLYVLVMNLLVIMVLFLFRKAY